MLLANMAKSDHIERLLTLKRDIALGLSASDIAINQLMDCFVKGAEGSWNPKANFNYLAYLFADLAKVGNCCSLCVCGLVHLASCCWSFLLCPEVLSLFLYKPPERVCSSSKSRACW